MIIDVVDSVVFVKSFSTDVDLCKITIGFDEIYIFGKYNELMSYIGKTVSYNTRPDVIEGKLETVIAHIAEQYVVQTVEKTENIKLIPEDLEYRSVMNFDSTAFGFGDFERGVIAYLSSYTKGSSKKTTWIDMDMVDCKSKVFQVRMFTRNLEGNIDPIEVVEALVGNYVTFDVTSTKYGLQTQELDLYDIPVVAPPEVEIAARVVMDVINKDPLLKEFEQYHNFVEVLKSVVDVEPGYHLVKIAAEIYMINAITDISSIYDKELLYRAAITSRGYLIPAKTKFSVSMLNVDRLRRVALGRNRDLILILDVASREESSPTKKIYMQINKLVDHIINERRNLNEENKDAFVNALDDLRSECPGLL